MLKSPLKYPGGKADLLKSDFKFPSCDRFIEPFAGSAVCSLNSPATQLIIADSNWDIVNFFSQIEQGHVETILYKCEEYWKAEADLKLASLSRKEYKDLDTDEQRGEVKYQVLRHLFNVLKKKDKEKHALKLACIFLYLNRHGFNGLCRYNKKGEYNVPYGKYVNPYFPEKELLEVSKLFNDKRVLTIHCDFEDLNHILCEVDHPIGVGDLVYCDPPYYPTGKQSFTTYDGNKFDDSDHEWLHEICKVWADHDARVILSNSKTDFTLNLYKHQRVETRQSKRSISAEAKGRKRVEELIVYYE